jgi:hypothetical protein
MKKLLGGVLSIATSLVAFARCFGEGVAYDGGRPDGTSLDASRGGGGGDGAVDAERPRFCEGAPHGFCDDFDEGDRQTPTGARWLGLADDAGQTPTMLSLDDSVAKSAPRSLALTTPTIGHGITLSSALVLDVPNSNSFPAMIRIEFDMRISMLASTEGCLVPARIRFGGSSMPAVGFSLAGTASKFYEESATDGGVKISSQTGAGPLVTLGQWQHVRLTITRETNDVSLTFDGVGATSALTLAKLGGPVQLELGAPLLTGHASAWKINFDNVTVDVVQ